MTNKITKNAEKLLKKKYFAPNENSYKDMCNRVANYIANNNEEKEEFYNMLHNIDFLPNSPVLMNSNTSIGYLSACNVAPIEDDMEDIFETLKKSTLIQKSGGGMGFSFSRLRPQGDTVGSTGKYSSGPISFMYAYDESTNTVKQGGKRRGANMGILRVDHPDIISFIKAKGELNDRNQEIFNKTKSFIDNDKVKYFEKILLDNQLSNFNISVAVTDKFMEAVKNKEQYELINPRTDKIWDKLYAPDVWSLIVEMAHKNAEPGLMFIDEVNRQHPAPEWIESFNVCGEQPLLPWESCILGAVNLSNMLIPINPKNYDKNKGNYRINYKKLEENIRTAVRFLDNTIDLNEYPVLELEESAKKYRKIGVGIMGWHEMLIKLNIRYGSGESLELAEEMSKFINDIAIDESQKLGEEKGIPQAIKTLGLERRNLVVTNAAPTGSRGFIANTSSGIEPFFSFEYTHTDAEGNVSQFNYNFIDDADENVLVTAMDILPEEHVKMQAAWQKHLGAAISKTVNLPSSANQKDVSKIYKMAYETNCKGITVYRNKSKTEQVLSTNDIDNDETQHTQSTNIKAAKESLVSIKETVYSGCGRVYLHADFNPTNGNIEEVFVETDGKGGCLSSLKAIGIMVSHELRAGISLKEVADQLDIAYDCGSYQYSRGKGKELSSGFSCASAIGRKLLKIQEKLHSYYKGDDVEGLVNIIAHNGSVARGERSIEKEDECPECGAELNYESSCYVCPSCGYSKCS